MPSSSYDFWDSSEGGWTTEVEDVEGGEGVEEVDGVKEGAIQARRAS
jgi:hypothetical protein